MFCLPFSLAYIHVILANNSARLIVCQVSMSCLPFHCHTSSQNFLKGCALVQITRESQATANPTLSCPPSLLPFLSPFLSPSFSPFLTPSHSLSYPPSQPTSLDMELFQCSAKHSSIVLQLLPRHTCSWDGASLRLRLHATLKEICSKRGRHPANHSLFFF